ncbi:MAG: thioredoxin [Pseudomonadota bacterium]
MTELSAQTSHVSDSTDQTFMTDVIEASNTQPVLVDFWAPWCGPCKTLTPVLEKVVNGENGRIKLVKVNIDDNPGIAGQLGVRSIPAVFAFDKGRPVNAFQGALPEGQLREFVEQIIGGTDGAKQLDAALEEADAKLQAEEIGEAAQIYGAIIEADPTHVGAIAGLARCYLKNGDPERAQQVLAMTPPEKLDDPLIKSVQSALELLADAPEDAELHAAQTKVSTDPADIDARMALAELLAAKGETDAAVEHLFAILEKDLEWQEGRAKTKLLELFEAAGPKDPVTIRGRRRLSSMLFA